METWPAMLHIYIFVSERVCEWNYIRFVMHLISNHSHDQKHRQMKTYSFNNECMFGLQICQWPFHACFCFFFCFFALGIVDYEIVVRRPLNGAMNSLRHAIFFSFYCVEFGCILFSFRWGLGV